MTDKDVLTQDEIDALLSGVDEGSLDTDVDENSANVTPYDLTSQDKVVRGRMPTLEVISERFARKLRSDLPSSLKFPIEVGPGGVQVLKFSEYVDMLFVPTCVKLLRVDPFVGTCLIALDAKLIHRIVDRFFGGDGMANTLEGKDFTMTEHRVIDRVLNLVIADYEEAWEDVLPIKVSVIGEEVNPALINVMGSSEVLMVSSFRLELDGGGGELHIAFPYVALEPYKALLDATSKKDNSNLDAEWRSAMERALLDAEVPISALIGDVQLRLRDMMRFEPDDIIDLDLQDNHPVRVAGIPTFTASLGDSRGKFALEFDSFNEI
jgi:flagellar motor switch protein FliM